MSRPTRTHRRRQSVRPRSLALLLLVLLQVAQPALASVAAACAEERCGTPADGGCCCGPEALAPLPVVPALPEVESGEVEPGGVGGGCCASDEPAPAPVSTVEPPACRCGAGDDRAPAPTPAVPARSGTAGGELAPADWIRLQAELDAFTPRVDAPHSGGDGSPPGRVATGAGGPACVGGCGAGALTLLARGVSGLLALLSVSRC